jgi:hypothetical protein
MKAKTKAQVLDDLLASARQEPEGVIARSEDGRLFFLNAQQAKQFEVPASRLYQAYVATGQAPGFGHPARSACAAIRKWLDTHSPRSSFWRHICLWYFDNC